MIKVKMVVSDDDRVFERNVNRTIQEFTEDGKNIITIQYAATPETNEWESEYSAMIIYEDK